MSAHQEKVPENGWIVELSSAKEKAKTDRTASAQLQIAEAAFRVRQWKVCQKAATLGLSLVKNDNEESIKKRLARYQKIATKEHQADETSKAKINFHQDIFDSVRKDDQCIDRIRVHHVTFGNLNFLQWAAMTGDIHLLESAVALGAAIDYPMVEYSEDMGPYAAPPESTALVLLCSSLAMYANFGDAPGLMTPQLKKVLKGNEDCAIALVQLGADCSKKLLQNTSIPPANTPFDPNFLWKQLNLYGKTARELVIMSGKTNLINAMKDFETKQDRIDKAHCRCGSRLPWLQCHAGQKSVRSPHYHEMNDDGSELAFRYSPLATCPCKHTQKTYWKCCWDMTSRPYYQDDTTGKLVGSEIIRVDNNPVMKAWAQAMAQRKQEIIDSGGDLNEPLFPEMASLSLKERNKKAADFMRRAGSMPALSAGWSVHPKSQVETWDVEVFAGTYERIENSFHWNDCHWRLDKTELLVRVKEWNDALEEYCNDTGLTGAERERVIAKHTANPCAPCGNISCDAFEVECKEFQRCSRCKSVGYCSSACQKSDWRRHKQSECIPR